MDKAALIEKLADIEHQRWSDWQKWVHRCCREYDGSEELDIPGLLMPAERVQHWERQIATPYADLSEREKQSDRDQVARYWPLIVEFVEGWIEAQGNPDYLAETWMGEMGTREVMATLREMQEAQS